MSGIRRKSRGRAGVENERSIASGIGRATRRQRTGNLSAVSTSGQIEISGVGSDAARIVDLEGIETVAVVGDFTIGIKIADVRAVSPGKIVLQFNRIGFQVLCEVILADAVRHIGPIGDGMERTRRATERIARITIRIKCADRSAQARAAGGKKSSEDAIPYRGDAPIVKAELIADAQLVGHGINAGPISVYRVTLCARRPGGGTSRGG